MGAGNEREIKAVITARNEAASALKSFEGNLLAISVAAGVVTAALAAITAIIAKVTQAAANQEEADVRLAAALRTVGLNTEENRSRIGKLALDLQRQFGIADEEILKVSATLIQFGNLSGANLERATRATLDYAAATGQDAASASLLLSKAIEGGVARLQGLKLDLDQNATAAERFSIIMNALERHTSGTAGALGSTLHGSLQKIELQFGELEETIGKTILSSQAFRDALILIEEKIVALNEFLKKNPDLVQRISNGFLQLGIVIADMLSVFAKFGIALVEMGADMMRILPLTDKEKWTGISKGMDDAFHAIGPLQDALAEISKKLEQTGQAGKDVAASLGKGSGGAASAFDTFNEILKRLGITSLQEVKSHAEQAVAALNLLGTVFKGKEDTQLYRDTRKALLDLVAAGRAAKAEFDGKSPFASFSGEITNFGLALRQSGITPLEDMIGKTRDLAESARLLNLQLESGLPGKAYAGVAEQLIAINEELRKFGLQVNLHLNEGIVLTNALGIALQDAAVNGAAQLGDAFVDAALGAKVSWQQTIVSILAGIEKAILRALILKAIESAFGGGAGAAVAGGGEVRTTEAAAGGIVRAQSGFEVRGGILGSDSVRALLQPGEVVLPARLRDDFQAVSDFAKIIRRESRGGFDAPGSAALANQAFNSFGILPRRDREDTASLMEAINYAVERQGYRLVASQVVR